MTVTSSFVNRGLVSPGILDAEGQLEVFGDYAQDTEGVFSVRIGGVAPGSEHDKMYVLGQAALDGALDIELAEDFLTRILNKLTLKP